MRKRIADLQEYRRNGITTLAEADRYEQAKQQRMSFKASSYRESVSLAFDRSGAAGAGGRRPTPQSTLLQQLKNRPAPPLTLATSASLQLLTPLEVQLCSTLRILPRPYLFLKEVLLREYVRLKERMDGAEARRAVVREQKIAAEGGAGALGGLPPPSGPETIGAGGEWGEKIERVWEFLRETTGLRDAARAAGSEGEGGDAPAAAGGANGREEAADAMGNWDDETGGAAGQGGPSAGDDGDTVMEIGANALAVT